MRHYKRILMLTAIYSVLLFGALPLVQPPTFAQESDIIRGRFAIANKAYKLQDFSRAYYWWNILAQAGHAKAQTNLGLLFLQGKGVEKNVDVALRWIERAAQQGVATAQYNLGHLYSTLKGDRRDQQKASFWYLKAAEQAHPNARYRLAQRYERGIGIKRDYVQALRWTMLAALVVKSKKLKARIANFRNELLEKMPKSQIAKATKLSEETKGN